MVSSRELRLAELRPYVDKTRRMRGWSFDTQTIGLESAMPWDYDERARELMLGAKVVLEMGTGEGERFPRLCDGYPGIALATEGWPPNVPVAATRLAPMGIDVLHASGLHLPLGDASLGLAFNRHTVAGFDLEQDLDALLALERAFRHDEGVVLTHSHFVIEAEKP